MTITDAYGTPQGYRAVTGKTDTADDALIDRHLVAASRVFERETGQFFGRDAEAVARIFVARDSRCLDLTYEGNCPGIATNESPSVPVIKVDSDGDGSFSDESAWSAGDYELWPLQAAQGPEPRPWDRIVIPRWSNKSFPVGNRVQVTAVFGWPAVPAAVESDIYEIVGIWRGENPRATGTMNELDTVIAASPMAMSLVKRWRDAYVSTRVAL